MEVQLVDVAVRIYDDLNPDRLHELEDTIREVDGVVSIHSPKGHPHVLLVEYNRARVNSIRIIDHITQHGVNAELAVPERIF